MTEILSPAHVKGAKKPYWFHIWHFYWSFSECRRGKQGSERVNIKAACSVCVIKAACSVCVMKAACSVCVIKAARSVCVIKAARSVCVIKAACSVCLLLPNTGPGSHSGALVAQYKLCPHARQLCSFKMSFGMV